MSTIILTGGGTAGHCTPHIALLPYLKKDFDRIVYIGSKNGIERNIIEKLGIEYYYVHCSKLNRKFTAKNLNIPFNLFLGIKEAKQIIEQVKPNVIFSKGGYVSIPTVIAGYKKNIPVISHESDLTIGLANKITAKYCKKVITSFPETAKTVKNGEYIGSPLRKNLYNINKTDAIKYFDFKNNKPIILIMGGSLGSQTINNIVRNCLNELLIKYNIIHICGQNNLDKSINKEGYYQTEFIDKIEYAFNACSICVSRAGANTLFELLSLKIPCLLIPLPVGQSRGDQVLNAFYYQKLGMACVLEEKALTTKSLLYSINSLYNNKSEIIKNCDNNLVQDQSRYISHLLFDYANN